MYVYKKCMCIKNVCVKNVFVLQNVGLFKNVCV